MSVITTTRNANLGDIHEILTARKAQSRDLVVPAANLRMSGGQFVLRGLEPVVSDEGVTDINGAYGLTQVADEGLADKLGIPAAYYRRMRETNTRLLDGNVNSWVAGEIKRKADGEVEVIRPADDRNFLLRTLFDLEGRGNGVVRAVLSDRYKAIDDLDLLIAALDGMRKAGVRPEDSVITGSLTERRMYLDVTVPGVRALAPILLGGYRSPFDGPNAVQRAGDAAELFAGGHDFGYGTVNEPVVFAGFRIRTSEVGEGAASVTPWIKVKICNNGMTVGEHQVRYVHRGSRLEEGSVDWSGDTYRSMLTVITNQTADAVARFLSKEFLAEEVAKIETKAGKPVEAGNEEKVVRDVTKSLGFSLAEQQGVLSHFFRGGQMTSGGLLNAVTSYSQTIADTDRAAELDAQALVVLDRV